RGELDTPQGVHAWILKGPISQDSAIVVWTDRLESHETESIRMFLGSRRIQSVDAFGNARDVQLVDGLHVFTPTEMPVFIENVNLEVAQFRSVFALDSNFLTAQNQMHQHAFVVHNPWNTTITGELIVTDPADLDISPRTIPFDIRAGKTVRLPVQIVVGRNVLGGPKTIKTRAIISADHDYTLDLQTKVEVGLLNVKFTASWGQAISVQSGQRNLIVTQTVTNTGSDVINLDVFIMAPDIQFHRRRLPPLSPGESATRRFNLGQSASPATAMQIRVGVEERDGSARLNRLMTIPVAENSVRTAQVIDP
ncbi:MAG: hypothetical protein O7G85_13265, partial [Planctomycetota bacterium]|nr:hypothetical protein [Planctomycetota bacterium]